MLRQYMQPIYIDLVLPDNTTGSKHGWFYLNNLKTMLPTSSGYAPVPRPEWSNQLTSREIDTLNPLLEDLERLKTEGLTVSAVAISFSQRLLEPIQEQLHPAYEYRAHLIQLRSHGARSPWRRWWRE
jgi:hypothetical protein